MVEILPEKFLRSKCLRQFSIGAAIIYASVICNAWRTGAGLVE